MSESQTKIPPRRWRNNPYELLILALLLFLPGIFVVQQHGQGILAHRDNLVRWGLYEGEQSREGRIPNASKSNLFTVLSESETHAIGYGMILGAAGLTWLYFYVRRQIALDDEIPHRRQR